MQCEGTVKKPLLSADREWLDADDLAKQPAVRAAGKWNLSGNGPQVASHLEMADVQASVQICDGDNGTELAIGRGM